MRTLILSSLAFFFILTFSGCDPTTFTSYFIENDFDENIEVYFKFSDLSVIKKDSLILLDPEEQLLFSTVEKMGHEDYQEFDEFIQMYDSIVAIRSDTIVSKNLINKSDWIFTIKGDDSAAYRLVIDEDDF